MFHDAYTKLKSDHVESFLQNITPLLMGQNFAPATTVVLTRPLSFWGDAKLYDIADHRTLPPARAFVVQMGDAYHVLNFTPTDFQILNAQRKPHLNLETITDYVRCFIGFTRGQDGRFIIVETVDDIPWKEDPPPQARKAVGKLLTPVHATIDEHQGVFKVSLVALYKTQLLKLNLDIRTDGMVTLMPDGTLLEDLPVLDDILGQ